MNTRLLKYGRPNAENVFVLPGTRHKGNLVKTNLWPENNQKIIISYNVIK